MQRKGTKMLRTIISTLFAVAILSGCASYHSDVEEATVEAGDASAEGMTEDMATEEGQTGESASEDEGQGGGERVGG